MTEDNEVRMLPTTVDNPYNPFTEWNRWYAEDLRRGHDTCGLLARLAPITGDLVDDGADEEAMWLLIHYNYSGKHIVVTPDDYDPYLKPQAKAQLSFG